MFSRLNSEATVTFDTTHKQQGPISWLKKKSSTWSLRPQNNLASVSTASLPISLSASESSTSSLSSLSCTSILSIPDPPSYEDACHPWAIKLPDSLSSRIIIPREEEGQEELPPYQCTIDKITYLRVKCEYTKPNHKSKSRSWKEYYVHVYGTKISAYTHNPCRKNKRVDPVWSFSMQDAEISQATDYRKHQFVLRLNISNGPQFLLTTYTAKDKFDCMDVMESSIAISADLDVREMPQLTNLQRRRGRRARR